MFNFVYAEEIDAVDIGHVANHYLLEPSFETESLLKLAMYNESGQDKLVLVKSNGNRIELESVNLADQDGDEIPGLFERQYGLADDDESDKFLDGDGDLLSNIEEYLFGTDPTKADTDNDGVSDYIEIENSTDPLDRLAL